MGVFQACEKGDDKAGDHPVSDVTSYYRNPLEVPDADEIADPMVHRYKNLYYLLSTQMYSSRGAGMTVWVSHDLVNWEVHRKVPVVGNVEALLAPELVYSEGTYYLYWSVYPGEVHYAARYTPGADVFDPFGPDASYEIASYDFLHVNSVNIDGEIFFDNNDLYMFYCGFGGIQYKKLKSLRSSGYSKPSQLTSCVVKNIDIGPGEVGSNGWTEAPGIFFEDGYYYLTYSGVHFQRPDYQIHSARGSSIPVIAPHKENPLIWKFDGIYNGMGNNNFTLGPDLTTKFLTYHVKVGEGIFTGPGGIDRRLMLDRYRVSSDSGIITDAPTLLDEPVPDTIGWENMLEEIPGGMLFNHDGDASMKVVSGSVEISTEGGNSAELLSMVESGDDFVVEGNARGVDHFAGGDPRYGLSTCEGKIKFAVEMAGDQASPAILTYYIENEGWINTGIENVSFLAWHKLRIDKKDNRVKFYYDDRYVGETSVDGIGGGKLGYLSTSALARYSWIGFSDY